MVECSFTNLVAVGSNPIALTLTSDIAPVSSKGFLDIQATIECRFTVKCVRHMIIIYSQIGYAEDIFIFADIYSLPYNQRSGYSDNVLYKHHLRFCTSPRILFYWQYKMDIQLDLSLLLPVFKSASQINKF